MLDFVEGFLYIYWDHVIFVFKSICVVYYIYWLAYVETSLYFRENPNLVMVDNIFYICLYFAFEYLIEYVWICVYQVFVSLPGLGLWY